MEFQDERKFINNRISDLERERSTFMDFWREIAHWITPYKGRFLTPIAGSAYGNEHNNGRRRNKHIINSTADDAKDTARAGLFAGTMSATSPWFKLETVDRALMRISEVRNWVADAERLIRTVLFESNFYTEAPIFLDEAMLFGTSAMSHVDDFDTVAHFHTHTIGSYLIGVSHKGEVDTFVLKKMMTCAQIVDKWGLEKASPEVQSAYKSGKRDTWFPVIQYVDPNPDYRKDALDARYKKYRSVWFEPSNQSNYLDRSGFDRFPFYVLRWDITAEDIYGTSCPGMKCLGDVKQLQILEREKAINVKKVNAPLLQGPSTLKNVAIPNAPNGFVSFDSDGQNRLTAVYQINPQIQEMRIDMDQVEARIKRCFFVDLFFAISNMRGIQPRNQDELYYRNQEALLVLGPVLERLQREFQNKVVERVFQQLAAADMLPELPEALRDGALEVRFIGSLAQAQKSSELGALERYTQRVGELAAMDPSAWDKFDIDEAVELFGQYMGAPPTVTRDDKATAAIREARAQALAEQQQIQNQAIQASANSQNASAVKQLSEIE